MAGRSAIAEVGFALAGDEENRRAAHAEVVSYELYTAAGVPVSGGVNDLHFGTTDHSFTCLTCGHGKKLCPGHRGRMSLRAAVVSPIAVAEVRRWLRVVCHSCGAIVVPARYWQRAAPGARLAAAAAAAAPPEGRRCEACSAVQPRVVKDREDNFTFRVEPPRPRAAPGAPPPPPGSRLWPDTIRAILERVSDADVAALGRSAAPPTTLVLREVAVPPNTVRPGVRSYAGGGNSYHDSTNLLQNLAKRNAALPAELPEAMGPRGPGGATDPAVERAVQNLQQIYYDMVYGSSATHAAQGAKGRRGIVVGARSVHSFLRNLPRKEGRLRGNLLGKRVFNICRTVISGTTALRIGELGVPLAFARTLQVAEEVRPWNRARLAAHAANGAAAYPGATRVLRRATGAWHDVGHVGLAPLEDGDLLLRDLVTGDRVYFNRAPTLERSSIGVHRAVILRDPAAFTLQVNVLACVWYNADFDGDAMVAWAARGAAPRAEAAFLSAVENHFMSTKTSGPVNGQVQDSVVGVYELTRSAARLDAFHAAAVLGAAGRAVPARPLTGRELVAELFAETPVEYKGVPTSYKDAYAPHVAYAPDETRTVFARGALEGVLDKRAVGEGATGGLFHLVALDHGPARALGAAYAVQQAALSYLTYRGFTTGLADLLPPPAAAAALRRLVADVRLEADAATAALLRGRVVAPIDETVRSFYERGQTATLGTPDEAALRWVLAGVRPESNGFFRMVASGSKGKDVNFISISAVIGQTRINGSRPGEKFAFRRTLAYFPRFATEPAAHGHVASAYVIGMDAPEFVFQAMNGRFDLISKALSTSITGYNSRKCILAAQSQRVDALRRVSKDTRVVQFAYGEDCADPRALERVPLRTLAMDDAALAAHAWPPARGPPPEGCAGIIAAAVDSLRADRDALRAAAARRAAAGAPYEESFYAPFNPRRALSAVAPEGGPQLHAAGPALAERARRVEALAAGLARELAGERPLPAHLAAAAAAAAALVRAELTPAAVAPLTDGAFDALLAGLAARYRAALAAYGTAVGVQAGQALSEPLTQYMLDSHHRSVSGGTTKGGVHRFSEIFGARPSSAEADPTMRVALLPGPPGIAAALANAAEYVVAGRFVRAWELILEPRGALVAPATAGDAAWLAAFERAHPLARPPADLTNWCARLAVDRAQLVLKAVDLELLVQRIRARFPGAYVAHSPESAPAVAIRVWFGAALFRHGDEEARARELVGELLAAPVRGVRGIAHARVERATARAAGPGGALEATPVEVVVASGTNLAAAALLPGADPLRTTSSSVDDTRRVLGIEAARAKIVAETAAFMGDGAPNARHIAAFADELTRTGRVTSIERGGLAVRDRSNVLLRMANGDPIRVVTEAALTGARCRVTGVAGPLLLGSLPRVGSTAHDLVVDEAFVRANLRSVNSVLDEL